ncbi:MAG: TatD family hydrolase [Leptolyngbya sp. SIO4C1]|nr:TatD family hydrolase [Leptolyngbya sp. SIO4C1]
MQLIDTHVHLNFETFEDDLDSVAQAWRQAGVTHLVHSCVEPSEFSSMQSLADRFPELSLAVGLHPLDMDKWTAETPALIRALAESDERVVAIGETGLDFFKSEDRALQIAALDSQLAIAQALELPVIIHCRDAASEMLAVMQRFWQAQGPVSGVMHCWTGTPEETQQFLDLGFYISFSGIVTFKNAAQVQASAQMVPCDRILVETDCPFLSPVPKRKERRNQPAFVKHVAECVADLRHQPADAFAAQASANACRLFQLPVSL